MGRLDPEYVERFMREERNFQLLEPYVNSKTPMKGVCLTCGEEGSPTWSNVQKEGIGACRPCGNKKMAETRSLDPEYVHQFMREERNFRLTEEYQGAKVPMKGVCLACGAEGTPTWSYVSREGAWACEACGRKEGTKKRAEALSLDPEYVRNKLIHENSFYPLEPYVNTETPMRGICLVCKSPGAPIWNNASKENRGACSGKCRKNGQDLSVPAVAYLVGGYVKEAGPCLKVGIAEAQRETGRLSEHKRVGLDIHLATLHFPTGYKAKEFEDELKELINAGPGNIRDAGIIFNGSEEVFEINAADPEFLRDLLGRFGITNVPIPSLWTDSNYRSRLEAWASFTLAA